LLYGFAYLLPLLRRRIEAGRIVAARVQHHDSAARQSAQRAQHGIQADSAAGCIVVRIAVDLETGAFEDRAVIFPARVADPDLDPRVEHAQPVGAHLERAAPAERLRRDDAFLEHRRVLGAEQQMLRGAVECPQPVHWQVILGLTRRDEFLLGLLNAVQHRYLAAIVAVDADAEIDFLRIGIGEKRLGYADDRIDRRGLQRGQRG